MQKIMAIIMVLVTVFISFSMACGESVEQMELTSAYEPTVAVEWMDLLCDRVQAEGYSPPVASRIFAYSSIALYESVVKGMPDYKSLTLYLNDMPEMPDIDPTLSYDWPSSAISAMATVAEGLLEPSSVETEDIIHQLRDTQLENRRNAGVDEEIIERSTTYGLDVANAVLEWARDDGYEHTRGLTYEPPSGVGMWVRTPPKFAPALEPHWGQLRPFVIESTSSCEPPPPVTYSENPNSEFYQQAMSVYEAVNNLTADQQAIAEFWADSPGTTRTPPGHWLNITTQMVGKFDMQLDEAAELYALVGIALGDSFISCWYEKYKSNLLRPITYIQNHIDEDWISPVTTPPFPEYVSGHSVVSGAIYTVLTHILGTVSFTDTTHEDLGLEVRSFSSFEEAANEAAISRLYGGIHYPMGIENGIVQGECIGQQIIDKVIIKE